MKLKECMELGKCCGLTTLSECFSNVEIHWSSLFKWDEASKEISELVDEIDNGNWGPDDKIDDIVEKLGFEWYYETETDKIYNAPRLREKVER